MTQTEATLSLHFYDHALIILGYLGKPINNLTPTLAQGVLNKRLPDLSSHDLENIASRLVAYLALKDRDLDVKEGYDTILRDMKIARSKLLLAPNKAHAS